MFHMTYASDSVRLVMTIYRNRKQVNIYFIKDAGINLLPTTKSLLFHPLNTLLHMYQQQHSTWAERPM